MPCPRLCLAVLLAVVLLVPASARADSGLGFTGFEATAGVTDGRWQGQVTADLMITGHHGLQADAAWSDWPGGETGRLAGHLYMIPSAGLKYGVFALIGDVNGHDLAYGVAGAEGLVAVSDRTAVELRGGLGWANTAGLDTVFAGAGLRHRLNGAVRIEAGADIAYFDETWIDARSTQAYAGLRLTPDRSALGAVAELRHDRIDGRGGTGADTRLFLGLTLTLGSPRGPGPSRDLFRLADPFAPLVGRGLVAARPG